MCGWGFPHPPTHGRPIDPGTDGVNDGVVITVLLADDNLIVREGVRALLSREPDI